MAAKEEISLQDMAKDRPAAKSYEPSTSTRPVKKPSQSVFRYATLVDKLLMLLGTLLAVIAGFIVPLYVVLIGFAITDFAYHNIVVTNISFVDRVCNKTDESATEDLLEYVTSRDPDDLLLSNVGYYAIGLACMGVVYFVALFLSISLWSKAGVNQTKAIRCSFIDSLLKHNMTWYDHNSAAEKPTQLASAMFKIDEGIGANMAKLVTEAILILSHLIIALVIHWALFLLLFILFPVTVVIVLIVAKAAAKVQAREQTVFEKAGAIAEETIASIKTVMAFGGERKACESYDALLKELKKNSNMIHSLRAVVLGSVTFILFLIYGVGFWFGSYLLTECFSHPFITFGDIVIVTFEMSGAVYALVDLFPLKKSLDLAREAAVKLYEIIDEEEYNDESADSFSQSLDGTIEFNNVTFSYPARSSLDSRPVLNDLSLVVAPGQTMALVGPSGCGKSTILQLLLRLYDHNNGTITINNTDIRSINVQWLRNQIGIVSQEPVLFNATIKENIAMGKEGASLEEIKEAARKANAHKFIIELPQQYNTEVGESGSQLSGGQKQRIAIARALVKDPKILLLDEATSALDPEGERAVQEALERAKEGRTTIVIAHRLSTIRNADIIISLQDGHIIEQGRHEQLMFMRGQYYEMVMKQADQDNCVSASPEFKQSVAHTANERKKSLHRNKKPLLLHRQSEDSLLDYDASLRSMTVRSSIGGARYSIQGGTAVRGTVHELPTITELSVIGELSTDGGPLPQGAVNRSLKDLSVHFKLGWLLLVTGVIGFILAGVAIACLYLLVKESLKAFTLRGDLLEDIRDPSIALIFVGVAAMIFQLIGSFSLGVASTKLAEYVRSHSFRAIMKQGVEWFDRPQNSTPLLIAQLATDGDQIKEIVEVRLGYAVKSVATLIAALVIAFVSSWAVTLVLLPGLVLLLVMGYLQIRISKRYAAKSQVYLEQSIQTSSEAIINIRTVTTLGVANRIQRKYEEELIRPAQYYLKSEVLNAFLYAIAQGVFVLLMSAGLYVSAVVATVDDDTPYYATFFETGTALSALYFLSILFKRVWNLLPDLRKGKESCQRIIHLMQSNPTIDSWSNEGETLDDAAGSIELTEVSFSYETRPNILKDISLSVRPNTTLAIVGTSGSGKSTIVSLIERFYDVSSGVIRLDHTSLKALNVQWLRQQIGLVSQEPVLFDMTIAENIKYGACYRDDVTDDEMMEAARIANIHEFIMTQPQGYDTNVGLRGTQLSGGQKQRIAIARALVRNPKILLLDEATSALDTEGERAVQEALERAKEGRTTIVITHRLSTIPNASNILVLHDGTVIEQGTHDELMSKQGSYYYMHIRD